MMSTQDSKFYIKGFILLSIITLTGYVLKRADFFIFYPCILICFGLYYLLVSQPVEFKKLFLLGLIARIILLFATPELSDDFYRFIWDGALINEGYNPFILLPKDVVEQELLQPDFDKLFHSLNSQGYYTVYPTIIQLINTISVFVGKTVFGSLIVMKIIFLGFELISFYFLKHLLSIYKKPNHHIFWYWLCPLIILEFIGNLHHESIMIALVLGAIWYLKSERVILSALFLSLAIFTKLTPILFVPFFIFSISLKQNIRFITTLGLASLLLAFPIYYDEGYLFLLKSIQLYFSSFEFNSSFYQLALYIEKNYWQGFRWIYKIITVLIMGSWLLRWKLKRTDITYGIAIIYLIYVLSAQSVHPWYILPLLPLFLNSNMIKFYWIWLLLIPLTYITYINTDYQQRLWINIIEYGSIALFSILFSQQRILIKNT